MTWHSERPSSGKHVQHRALEVVREKGTEVEKSCKCLGHSILCGKSKYANELLEIAVSESLSLRQLANPSKNTIFRRNVSNFTLCFRTC